MSLKVEAKIRKLEATVLDLIARLEALEQKERNRLKLTKKNPVHG